MRTPADKSDGAQRLRDRPRQEDQARAGLSDDNGAQFPGNSACDRLLADDGEAPRRDARGLEAGRGCDHRGLSLRRRSQDDLSEGLESPQAVHPDRAAAALTFKAWAANRQQQDRRSMRPPSNASNLLKYRSISLVSPYRPPTQSPTVQEIRVSIPVGAF